MVSDKYYRPLTCLKANRELPARMEENLLPKGGPPTRSPAPRSARSCSPPRVLHHPGAVPKSDREKRVDTQWIISIQRQLSDAVSVRKS
ncbi:hypothetical protein RP20_CCG014169 [Aedes albopictus]|nr:hypothetical protein RP20_CCG014169 [Aedes albopictus]